MGAGDNSRLSEAMAYIFAGIAAFSFWQGVALAVTIIAGLISAICGGIRIYDRLRFGRPQ
jgi:hypothetical protein